jgi:hypothetical protein
LLSAADELFTNVNYIAMVRFEAAKQARGLVNRGAINALQVPQYIDAAVKGAFDKGGAAAANDGSPIFKTAYAYAKDTAFKTPLEFGLGGAMQKMKNEHPWLGFITPFIKTPTNIFRAAARMTPGYGAVQYAAEKRWGKLTADQLVRRRGEVILGTAFWGTRHVLHSNGKDDWRRSLKPGREEGATGHGGGSPTAWWSMVVTGASPTSPSPASSQSVQPSRWLPTLRRCGQGAPRPTRRRTSR